MKKQVSIFLMVCLLSVVSAQARDYYGAIAVDHRTGEADFVVNYNSEAAADEAAVKKLCNGKSNPKGKNNRPVCRVRYSFVNGCAAMGWSPTKKIAEGGFGKTTKEAINDAHNSCEVEGVKCKIIAQACTKVDYYYY